MVCKTLEKCANSFEEKDPTNVINDPIFKFRSENWVGNGSSRGKVVCHAGLQKEKSNPSLNWICDIACMQHFGTVCWKYVIYFFHLVSNLCMPVAITCLLLCSILRHFLLIHLIQQILLHKQHWNSMCIFNFLCISINHKKTLAALGWWLMCLLHQMDPWRSWFSSQSGMRLQGFGNTFMIKLLCKWHLASECGTVTCHNKFMCGTWQVYVWNISQLSTVKTFALRLGAALCSQITSVHVSSLPNGPGQHWANKWSLKCPVIAKTCWFAFHKDVGCDSDISNAPNHHVIPYSNMIYF